MPYKSEKINIAGTEFDRRIKMTEEDKELAVWMREEEQLSYQKIADKFGVSKSLIMFVCKPETLERNIQRRKERGGSKIYYDKDYTREVTKEHRRYKQELFLNNKIKL